MPESAPANGSATGEPGAQPPTAPAPVPTPPPAAPPAPPANEPQDVKSLPEWAQTLITNTRTEAAQHRTEKNSAVEAAKTELAAAHAAELEQVTGEKTAAEQATAAAQLELAKVRVALSTVLPDEDGDESSKSAAVLAFAGLLRGDNEEALKAHAAEVKKIFGLANTPAVDPTQGLTGSRSVDTAPGLSRLQYAYSQPKG